MDDMDVTISMGRDLPYMLTVKQAGAVLGIKKTSAYDQVKKFFESGGAEGIPAIHVGRCYRIPREELLDRIRRGCVTPSAAPVPDELASRRRLGSDAAGDPAGARRRVRVRREPPSDQPPLFPAG